MRCRSLRTLAPVQRAASVLVLPFLAFALPRATSAQEIPYQLDGLVVTATPVPVGLATLGSHVTLLKGDELRARGVVRVTDALREVPGLSVAQGGSYGGTTSVFLRGGESDYVLVMVDGVQMNQPGGSFDFSGLTTDNVERIEVVRGPSSALHGSDAVAGVIHIVTRDGRSSQPAALSVQGGTFGRVEGTLSVNGGNDRASYSVNLTRLATDGILAFNNRNENTVLTGTGSFALGNRSRARISARLSDRTFAFPTDFTGALVDTNQFTFSEEATVSMELDRQFTDRLQARVLFTSHTQDTGTDDEQDSPADTLGSFAFQSLDSFRRNSVDVRANWTVAEGLVATAGGELETQDVRSFNESRSQFGPSNGRSRNERSNAAGYLHLTGRRGRLSANGGLRVEDNGQYGTFTTWQLGTAFAYSPTGRIRAAAGRGIKEPTFFEAFATGFATGNPDLEPEVSTSWEVGVEHAILDGAVTLQGTFYDQRFEDLIQFTVTTPQPGDPNYFNVAEAAARGVEVGARTDLGPVALFADYAWVDTEVVDAGFDSGPGASFVEGEALLRRPVHTLTGGARWVPTSGLSLDATVRRVGDRSDRDFSAFPAEPVTLEAYTLADVGAQWTVLGAGDRPGGVGGGAQVALTFRVENLTDQDFQEVFGFRAPGRAFLVGGRVTLGN